MSKLDLSPQLVPNSDAKTILQPSVLTKKVSTPKTKTPKKRQKRRQFPKMNQLRKLLKKQRLQRDAGTSSEAEIHKLEDIYRKGPAAYGSVASLGNASGFSLRKVENFLQGKNAHSKYRQFPLRYPRLKVIKYDINEVWSINVVYVDKLAKFNHGVKYLLVAVGVLSRKLRVEPMRSKTAKETAKIFARIITKEKHQKIWLDKGTDFKEHSSGFVK